MVNCEAIYEVVKYRTELGGWNLYQHATPYIPLKRGTRCGGGRRCGAVKDRAYTHPSAPSGHLESGAIATGDRIRKSLRFP